MPHYHLAKYNASGNDFVIFHDFIEQDRSELAKILCNRQSGIGADGLIVCIPHEEHDFKWQFYNDDGSSAEMCGNGSRACAHYAFNHQLAPKEMSFLTLAGPIKADVNDDVIQVELTPPVILDDSIKEYGYTWWLIDTGVPHLVTFDMDIDDFKMKMARKLRKKYNCNVNVAFIHEEGYIKVRTYERGVEAETLACGTGVSACYYRAYKECKVETETTMIPKSGEYLRVAYNGKTLTFKGRVSNTFNTTWSL